MIVTVATLCGPSTLPVGPGADKVTANGIRDRAQRLAGIADEIAAAASDGDWARQALISTEYFDVLGTLLKECKPQ